MPGATLPEIGAPGRDRGARARILQNAEFCRFEARTSIYIMQQLPTYRKSNSPYLLKTSLNLSPKRFAEKLWTFSVSPFPNLQQAFCSSRCSTEHSTQRYGSKNSTLPEVQNQYPMNPRLFTYKGKEIGPSTTGRITTVPFHSLVQCPLTKEMMVSPLVDEAIQKWKDPPPTSCTTLQTGSPSTFSKCSRPLPHFQKRAAAPPFTTHNWSPRGSRRTSHLSSEHGRKQCPTTTNGRQLPHVQLSQQRQWSAVCQGVNVRPAVVESRCPLGSGRPSVMGCQRGRAVRCQHSCQSGHAFGATIHLLRSTLRQLRRTNDIREFHRRRSFQTKLEVVVLRGTLDGRTNLGWQLMRMPVTTPPGCQNACNYADFIQSGQSVVLSLILCMRYNALMCDELYGDERLEEVLNEENLVDVEVKTEQ
ncbi:hypothetical protein LR48_Vigan03g014800 [Vigna angularis]|uniref:Uncharacterized protein n=1 Tax=Phaseolus angularis TaxID=3914 RepID=A0A0L9U266_PHAAN|nr:hypothetical protein LR48_Vigan03g014800 [Vigna angularis]